MMSPYDITVQDNHNDCEIDQTLEDISETVKIKREKLHNEYKNVDFLRSLETKLKSFESNKEQLVATNVESQHDQPISTLCKSAIKPEKAKVSRPVGSRNKKNSQRDVNNEVQIPTNKKQKPSQDTGTQNNPVVLNSSQNIEVCHKSELSLSSTEWLTSSHIDEAMKFFPSIYNPMFSMSQVSYWQTTDIERITTQRMEIKDDFSTDHFFILNSNNDHWFLLTNVNPSEQLFLDSYGVPTCRNWYIYDSLNTLNSVIEANQF
jgi:hypothetical protein